MELVIAIGAFLCAITAVVVNASQLERSNCETNAWKDTSFSKTYTEESAGHQCLNFADLIRLKYEGTKNFGLVAPLYWNMNPEHWDEIAQLRDNAGRYLLDLPTGADALLRGDIQGNIFGYPVEIDLLATDISLLKKPTHCEYCGNRINEGARCSGCGAPYPKKTKHPCSYCGSEKQSFDSKCSRCGAR